MNPGVADIHEPRDELIVAQPELAARPVAVAVVAFDVMAGVETAVVALLVVAALLVVLAEALGITFPTLVQNPSRAWSAE